MEYFQNLRLLALTLILAGCASFSGIAPSSKVQAPATLGAAQVPIDWPAADWWTSFGDPTLGHLIDKALAGNPNLKLAQARVTKAYAQAGSAESALWPQVNADADSTRQRFSENGIYPPPLGGSTESLNNARLGASWELDFFGRNRAALDAALGSARAAEADAQAARVLLATDVARTYFSLARLLEQRRIAEDTRTQRVAILDLVKSRVQAGLDTNVELRQAEGAVPEIQRDIEALGEQIALARNALAALLGEGPQATAAAAPGLAVAQVPTLPAAIPADLVGRRADLSAARWRVEAAGHGVDEAKAEFYPNVNLMAFVGFSSLGLSRWFDSGSREHGIGAAIHLPIFDAGRLRANLRGRSADVDAAVESYNATLVEAVHDVADQIATLQSVEKQAQQQQAAAAAADQAFDLAMQRYRAGLGTYLTVLTAEANVLTQHRATTDLKARNIDANLKLVRALGGGFSEAPKTAHSDN